MNKKVIKWFMIFLCALPLCTVAANKEKNKNARYPLGCLPVGYKFSLRTVDLYPKSVGERHSLYFVYNKTTKPISLYHMRGADSARSVHLNHKINPNRWAVLATSEKHIKYACAIPHRKSKYGKLVDCEQSLKICEFTRVRYGLNNRGNYWLARGNTRGGAVREVVWYGIIPQ